jgi:hypothetical protein
MKAAITPIAMLPNIKAGGASLCGGCPDIWKNANAEIAKIKYPQTTAPTDRKMFMN